MVNTMNIVVNFPWIVWALVAGCAGAAAFAFALAVAVYGATRPFGGPAVKQGTTTSGIVFQVLATLTEPQGMELFKEWCAGELIT